MAETIQSIDPFERDFEGITSDQKEKIISTLRSFASEIKLILRGTDRLTRILRPECTICHTCAFEPKTDVLSGFAATNYGLIIALLSQNKIFVCHEGHDWKKNVLNPDKVTICAGFERVNLFSSAQAVECARIALEVIRQVVPDAASEI